jgi:hypothetical protein
LWDYRRRDDGPTSHSQVLECISGSFIQSHWPWLTDFMFSTALAKARTAVPISHAALDRPAAMSDVPQLPERAQSDGAVDTGCIACAAGFFDVATNHVDP